MQIKRKQVKQVAVGAQFVCALGKDVTESALARKKQRPRLEEENKEKENNP